MKPEDEKWLKAQLKKRELKVPEFDPLTYDAGGATREELVKDSHVNGIDQTLTELALPLLQENEKMRENVALLIEYLDRQYSQGRFSRVTKYGRAVESLRNLITDTKY